MTRERIEERDASIMPTPGHELMKRRQEALFGKGRSRERGRVDNKRIRPPMDPGEPLREEARVRRRERREARKNLAAQRNRSTS